MGLLIKRLTCIGSLRAETHWIFCSVLYVVQMHRISLVTEYYRLLGCDSVQFGSSVQMFQRKLWNLAAILLCYMVLHSSTHCSVERHIVPFMLYGCETWSHMWWRNVSCSGSEMNILEIYLGKQNEIGGWKMVLSEELFMLTFRNLASYI